MGAQSRRFRIPVLCFVLLGLVALCYGPLSRLWVAKEFLQSLSGPSSNSASTALVEADITIPGADGPIRARLYRPADNSRHKGLVVGHGVHYQGIDERRLVPFVRQLARQGLVVLTPELVDLADYRLTRSSVDRIATAVRYLTAQHELIEGEQVGLLGFSFAGGLGLVAASEPRLAHELRYVVSVGGHHDLGRVLRFLLTDEIETPSGKVHAKAHDYGLAVVLYGHLEDFVDEPELTPTREALRAWLHEDRPRARAIGATLKGEGARLFQLVEEQKLPTLAPQLKAMVEKNQKQYDALSPRGRLGRIDAPVYLLHGSHDSVIPPSEADFAGLELGSHCHDVLVTPLIEHVEISRTATLRDKLALVAFMAHLF
jgi:pimeloyl-ACP methyl ester carboxylesterase